MAEAARSIAAELARRLGTDPADPVRFEPSPHGLRVRSGGREASVAELLTPKERAAGGLVRPGRHYGRGGTIEQERVVEGDFYALTDFTASVHLAAVRVDRDTGQITGVRYAAFQDAGVVVDPPTFRGQVEGGVVMGLGTALTEESLWSPGGILENPGLLDYRLPTIPEVPAIEVIPLEGFPGAGPFGAKGIGEPPMVPVAAAIANAVADATGRRPTELPLTPERVARALMAP